MAKYGSYGIVKFFTEERVAEKRSQFVDYSLELESLAMISLKRLGMPHFCEMAEELKYDGLRSPRLLMKLIDGSTLFAFLNGKSAKIPTYLDLVYQTMIACEMMHRHAGMSHNDLHTGNVMVTTTDVDVNVYRFEDKTYAFTSHGLQPIIIDFGFTYTNATKKMLTPSSCTDIGYFPFEKDFLSDVRLLLCGCLSDLTQFHLKRNFNFSNETTSFSKIVSKMFESLPIYYSTGTFVDDTFVNLLNAVIKRIYGSDLNRSKESWGVFNPTDEHENMHVAIKILMANVDVPEEVERDVEDPSTSELRSLFLDFVKDWKRVSAKLDHFVSEEMLFLKHLFSEPTEYLIDTYGSLDPLSVRVKLTKLVLELQRHVNFVVNRIRDQKRKAYENVKIVSMLEVLDKIDRIRPVKISLNSKVAIYDCVGLKHETRVMNTRSDISKVRALLK